MVDTSAVYNTHIRDHNPQQFYKKVLAFKNKEQEKYDKKWTQQKH